MVQVLAVVRLPEAGELERLRKDVLGITPEAVEAPPMTAAPTATVSPGVAACRPGSAVLVGGGEPHDAFKNPATIDELLFAATLGGVHAGAARPDYLEPEIFFAHTLFTKDLKSTISDIASCLTGGDGPSVTEMQTPFGGGKTHAFLDLYYLIKHPERSLAVPGVKEALGDVRLPAGAQSAVFDGQEYGVEPTDEGGRGQRQVAAGASLPTRSTPPFSGA